MSTSAYHRDPSGQGHGARPSLEEVKARLRALVETHSPGGSGDLWACPRHGHAPAEGGTPSLSLYDSGRRWKCHSCGAGGDALDFEAFATGRPLAEVIRRYRDGGAGPGGAGLRAALPAPLPVPSRSRRPDLADVPAAWARALASAQGAPPDDPGRRYVEQRYGVEGFRRLLEVEAVGLAGACAPEPWVRRMAASGYRVVLAVYGAPPSGELSAVAPVSLNARTVRPEREPRYLRPRGLPQGIGYGAIPAAIAEADGHTLVVIEGAGDYLRALARPRRGAGGVVAYVSTSTAQAVAVAVAAEIAEARSLGVGGPREVVAVPHLDENGAGERAGRAVVGVLSRVEGLTVRIGRFASRRGA